jgi:1D-myo-inositol-tetrakisphosphate 5-kinase/inositol-polyphosphate multikinase
MQTAKPGNTVDNFHLQKSLTTNNVVYAFLKNCPSGITTVENLASYWESFSLTPRKNNESNSMRLFQFFQHVGELLNLTLDEIKIYLFCEIEFSKVLTAILLILDGDFIKKMDFLLTLLSFDVMSKENFKSLIDAIWMTQSLLDYPLWAESESRLYGLDIFVTRALRKGTKDKEHITRSEFLSIIETYNTKQSSILETQTGGRVNCFRVLEGGRLAKKVSKLEHHFYTKVLAEVPEFQQFSPKFFGDVTPQLALGLSKENEDFQVEIENLCHNYEKPCVLDIKIGTTRASPDVDEERRKHILAKEKNTAATQIGLRVSGMRVWNEETNTFVQYSKSWGRAVQPENFVESLALFFDVQKDRTCYVKSIVPQYLNLLESLYRWALKQSSLRFFGSSLLFIYDGANPDKEPRFKMVDFAHVFPIHNAEHDEGLITGLRNLMSYFTTILDAVTPSNNLIEIENCDVMS